MAAAAVSPGDARAGGGVDVDDIQGIVRFGYGSLVEASFLLLRVRQPAAARAWIAAAPVASAAVRATSPETALQLAFTRGGLEALGVPPTVIVGFSAEFVSGMAGEASRSRRLGDIGRNAPERWDWGAAPATTPHVLVMLYAKEGRLDAFRASVLSAPWDDAFEVVADLPTSNLQGVEPFGFADGISQPTLDWERTREPGGGDDVYSNRVALGEFLLGYPNEYVKYTDRPLLEAADPGAALLPAAENTPQHHDLGRNGTYLVFRQLQQDVRGFWQFIDRTSGADSGARRRLGEQMVGRTMSGAPLLPHCADPIDGVPADDAPINQFTYDDDPDGVRCPLGAHVRRANPRNADYPPGTRGVFERLKCLLGFGPRGLRDDVIAPTRFHRILRRGREYGPGLSIADALDPDVPDAGEHGIHFICLGANISRQFEFVQGAWMNSTKFGGLTGESDPLAGTRSPVQGCPHTDAFTIGREDGLPQRVTGMPQFITVRGGAYFFLPGLRALRYIARQ